MVYDRQITISEAASRFGPWSEKRLKLSEFYNHLKTPIISHDTREQYERMSRAKQAELKDVGGFVGGELLEGIRKTGHVVFRDLITLDVDHCATGATATDDLLARIHGLGFGVAVYPTRKHRTEQPRVRVIIPTDRSISAEEYEPLARFVAEMIDSTMAIFDRTTFQPHRMMYWPSTCFDAKYFCGVLDEPLLCADDALKARHDWHDVRSWPRCPEELATDRAYSTGAVQQEDPTKKDGIIGAFCREYNIYEAVEKFLPAAYTSDPQSDRMTYTGGSTVNGAVVYGDGMFLYSHHDTDPASGHLCNAFDLVRLHRFGDSDKKKDPDTRISDMPSYKEMCKLASADDAVAKRLNAEDTEKARDMFADYAAPLPPDEVEMLPEGVDHPYMLEPPVSDVPLEVKRSEKGGVANISSNAWPLIETDVLLKDRIHYDSFRGRITVVGPVPWNAERGLRYWTDSDDAGIKWYIDCVYGYARDKAVMDGVDLTAKRHAVNPVKMYLEKVKWDGVRRLDTLFIDYLGAADNEYIRAATRKAFVGAVARTYAPGIKFDNMPIITGPQGLGKSTLLRKMAREWFNDSLQNFDGSKDAQELVQDSWIIEVGELGFFNKTESNLIKQFLSKTCDKFRASYGRRVEDHARHCIIFGTTNEVDYLKDPSGNRRFWPIDAGVTEPLLSVFDDLDDTAIDLLWAEAVELYSRGAALYMEAERPEVLALWADAIGEHAQENPMASLIEKYLSAEVPVDYDKWDEVQQQMWDSGTDKSATECCARRRVCAHEIWEHVYGKRICDLKPYDVTSINNILSAQRGFKRKVYRHKKYGSVRGFERY